MTQQQVRELQMRIREAETELQNLIKLGETQFILEKDKKKDDRDDGSAGNNGGGATSMVV